jgi:uncharacterized protein
MEACFALLGLSAQNNISIFSSPSTDDRAGRVAVAVEEKMMALLVWLLSAVTLCGQQVAVSAIQINNDQQWYEKKLASHETGVFSSPKIHILRLSPNEDLLESLWAYARVQNITAMSIISGVGSLTQTNIRYANQEEATKLSGHFEIVSLIGNIDYQQIESSKYSGSGHVHISCSDESGVTIGGHLLSENLVYTTVELTLLEVQDALFQREPDTGPGGSGYYELKVFHN